MKTMHRVWAAVLLKLGIIHGAGDRCEKWIGHFLGMRSFLAGNDTGEAVRIPGRLFSADEAYTGGDPVRHGALPVAVKGAFSLRMLFRVARLPAEARVSIINQEGGNAEGVRF